MKAINGLMRSITRFRLAIVPLVVVLALMTSATIALACEITTTSENSLVNVGDQQTITVQVKIIHKNCLVPIDQTSITADGLKIVTETPWKLSGSVYTKQLTVVFTDPGKAMLKVTRVCSKGGDTEQTEFTVDPAVAAAGVDIGHIAPVGNNSISSSSQKSEQAPKPGLDEGAISSQSITPTENLAPEIISIAGPTPIGLVEKTEISASKIEPTALSPRPQIGTALAGTASGDASSVQTPVGASVTWLSLLVEPKLMALSALTVLASVLYLRGLHRFRRLVLVFSLAYLGFFLGGCLCPLGAVQYLALPEAINGQKVVFVAMLGIPVLVALLLGRVYCGWICPAGALQELVHYSRAAVSIPPAWDHRLKALKYFALVALIAVVRITGEAVFKDLDPFKAAFNIGGETVAIVGLAVVLIASVFVYRPWCRYLCPVAVVFGIASRLGISHLGIRPSCVSCKQCEKACGVQALEIGANGKPEIDAAECLACGMCQEACRRNALGNDLCLPCHPSPATQPSSPGR